MALVLVALVAACAEPGALVTDAGTALDAAGSDGRVADGHDAGSVRADGAVPDARGSSDAGTPEGPREVPGGAPGTAPVVGCTDAERPARALASVGSPVCEASSGTCLYVAPDGDDAAAGTFDAPLEKPVEAIRRSGPGDVIYLRGGVYTMANAYPVAARTWDDPSAGIISRLIFLGTVNLPSWAGGEHFGTPNGTDDAPITIESYPGERACAENAGGVSIGDIRSETHDWNVEDITVRGGGVLIAGGARGPGNTFVNQTHHIALRRNEIYAVTGQRLNNTGLIRIDRGDWGGPSEIVVESNILHDLSVIESDGVHDWQTTTDAQHFGAVTTLSCESYIMPFGACGGNGRLVVYNNLIHDVPSALFFKNPTNGPVEVTYNTIHHTRMLGHWSPSNITFERNVLWNTGGAATVGGFGGSTVPEVYAVSGRNFIMRYNTFIGRSSAVELAVYGSGHTIRDNVIQGLAQRVMGASYNTAGYVSRHDTTPYPDTGGADLSMSELATGNDFDHECFVSPTDDFIALSRYQSTTSGWNITWLTMDQALATFGFHETSVIVHDPHEVFVDFDGGDYRVRSDGPCAAMGVEGT